MIILVFIYFSGMILVFILFSFFIVSYDSTRSEWLNFSGMK